MAYVDVICQSVLWNICLPICVLAVALITYKERLKLWKMSIVAWYADHLQRTTYSKHTARAKRRLFAGLHDAVIDRKIKQGEPLTVVEIEATGGVNFTFYPDGIRLICTNKNTAVKQILLKATEDYPEIQLEFLINKSDNLKMLPDDSVDVVISTFALSQVVDIRGTLKETLRILRPGGCFYFIEHVRAKENSWLEYLQRRLDRVIRVYLAGHSVHMDIEKHIRAVGFSKIKVDHFDAGFYFPLNVLRPHVAGKAIKAL